MQDEVDIALEAELYLHDDPQSSRPRSHRLNKLSSAERPPECRVMSLTSFTVANLVAGENGTNSLDGHHYVAAGCSDAVIRLHESSCKTLYHGVGDLTNTCLHAYQAHTPVFPNDLCYLRQYIYSEKEKQFTQLPSLTFHNKCILCVDHFFAKADWLPSAQQAFLCSTATDGRVAIWNLDGIICRWVVRHLSSPMCSHKLQGGPDDELCANAEPSCVFEAHQSGVNAISLHSMEGRRGHLVASVGDDNALAVSEFKVVTEASTGSPVVVSVGQCSKKNAHSSSITGVQFLKDNLLVTTSVDQRLNVWNYDPVQSTIKLTSSFTHDVADAANLQVLRHRDTICAIFCGVGIQYCCLTQTA